MKDFKEDKKKIKNKNDNKLSLSNIQEGAKQALLKTRQSQGMKTNNITERELELAGRAFVNGAVWAKNIIEKGEIK